MLRNKTKYKKKENETSLKAKTTEYRENKECIEFLNIILWYITFSI